MNAVEGAPRLASETWGSGKSAMPPELKRYQQSGHLHFVTFSCHNRQPYLITPEAKSLFEHALERMRVRYDFLVVAYVVMPERLHLLLSEPRKGDFAKTIQAIKPSVSVRRKERPFWLPRYHDFNVFTEKKVIEKRRYAHRNPVARGLTGRVQSHASEARRGAPRFWLTQPPSNHSSVNSL